MTEYPYGTAAAPPAPPAPLTPPAPPAFGGNDPAHSSPSPSLSGKASDTAEAGKQAAADVAETAADKAKDVAQETKKQARNLVGEARSQLTDQAGAQHRNLVTNLHALADELSGMVERSDNGGIATDLVSQAGDRAHSAADWLDQRQPGDLIDEVRRFARQRPGTFLLGAALAGVVVGRLTRGAVAAHSSDDDQPEALAAAPTTALPAAGYGPTQSTPTPSSPVFGATPPRTDGAFAEPRSGYGNGDASGTTW